MKSLTLTPDSGQYSHGRAICTIWGDRNAPFRYTIMNHFATPKYTISLTIGYRDDYQ
ncbi:MAG: hypothetical protein LKF56_04225 [Prevotella sp.]|nr:hypothetical protein [Prevotella sp.]MCH4018473.1 hypothetical protein [Prevotella sp.]MCH4186029.1 hypothetical protein [Prevotella sp.]MCI1415948.1 hypothetical protein [Prevotella sp.]